MEFSAYRVVEDIGEVRVLELVEIDWPVQKILDADLVDMAAYSRALEEKLEGEMLDCSPQEINPLIPTEFEYRPSEKSAASRSLKGIVVADDIRALVSFAENNLISVSDNPALNAVLGGGSASGSKDELNFRLVGHLNLEMNRRDKPYHAYPLLYRPVKNKNSTFSNPERQDSPKMISNKIDGEEYIFINLDCLEYYTADIRWVRSGYRLNMEGRFARNRDLRRQLEEYQPFYCAPRPVELEDEKFSVNRVDYVVSHLQRQNVIDKYLWSSGGEQGIVRDSKYLPLALLNNLDRNGRQMRSPASFFEQPPLPFLKPRWLLEIELEEFEDLISEPVKREQLPADFLETGVLENRWYVNDSRDRVNCDLLKEKNRKKGSKQAKKTAVPVFEKNSRLVAYILQKTKNGLYDPEHQPGPVEYQKLSGDSEIQFFLSEPVY
jgi:hypothetical protein